MSGSTAPAGAALVHGHDTHTHGHEHDAAHGEAVPHATLKGYLIGFAASVLLTVIPFWLVMGDVLDSRGLTIAIILAFAVIQMLVQVVYFLHLDTRSQGGWNMLAAIFTIVLVMIAVAGSLWVMFNMNANMMPSGVHGMEAAP